MNIKSNKDEFPDLPRSHPYYGPIHYFTGKKVLSGYEDGTFGPDNTLTRSELLAVVLRALDLEYDGEILVGIFKDVPKDHWVNPLINNALDRRIITADRPVFEPNRPVTRSEFLAILVVASQIDVDVDDVTKVWSDVSETHWSAKYAKVAYKYKLFSKLRDDTFGPNNSVTRGEVANAMYQFLFQTKNR